MKIDWDNGSPYQAGLDRGVLYDPNGYGVVWNGLMSVTERRESDGTKIHIDGQTIYVKNRLGGISGDIVGYTYPDVLDHSHSMTFGMCYRVLSADGYSLEILYGVKISPNDRAFSTIGSQISPGGIPWQMSAAFRVSVSSNQPYIDALEEILYGSDTVYPRLPSLDELYSLAEDHAVLRITDNGDGTWTADGPDDMVSVDGDVITISSPTLEYLSSDTYRVSSY